MGYLAVAKKKPLGKPVEKPSSSPPAEPPLQLTQEEQEELEERIAIMIYDGGLSEQEAEREALKGILRRRENGNRRS